MSYIKSRVADVKNSGYGCKNSEGLMSSLFLMNFIPKKYRNKWCHIDMAGPVDTGSRATGYGVALLYKLASALGK
jgi:leucyl aminopeptidase